MKKHPLSGAHQRARVLRRTMTDAERHLLWQILRSHQMSGCKFRRQMPLGRYIADFVCHEARLIVEIDGRQHDPASPQEIERTAFLQAEGYRILRFWNNEVLANLDGVYTVIVSELDRVTPTQTLPHRGGGPCATEESSSPLMGEAGRGVMLAIALNRIGQIALATANIDRAEAFYRDVLGLRHLYRDGDLTFFDCAGVRLLLEKSDNPTAGSPLYFICHDIALAVADLTARGVKFDGPEGKPHLIARMPDHDLWMAFFEDPDGHTLALMQEAPKGYVPPTT